MSTSEGGQHGLVCYDALERCDLEGDKTEMMNGLCGVGGTLEGLGYGE